MRVTRSLLITARYIINSAHSRFEPFEETICRQLFNKVPLLFILNKADLSSKEDRDGLREIIKDVSNLCKNTEGW